MAAGQFCCGLQPIKSQNNEKFSWGNLHLIMKSTLRLKTLLLVGVVQQLHSLIVSCLRDFLRGCKPLISPFEMGKHPAKERFENEVNEFSNDKS